MEKRPDESRKNKGNEDEVIVISTGGSNLKDSKNFSDFEETDGNLQLMESDHCKKVFGWVLITILLTILVILLIL